MPLDATDAARRLSPCSTTEGVVAAPPERTYTVISVVTGGAISPVFTGVPFEVALAAYERLHAEGRSDVAIGDDATFGPQGWQLACLAGYALGCGCAACEVPS